MCHPDTLDVDDGENVTEPGPPFGDIGNLFLGARRFGSAAAIRETLQKMDRDTEEVGRGPRM
jgi:hypothetical protein